jgi:N-methylhydantoinase A
VTDAHLVLGRLDADFFLGGEVRLDPQAAREQFEEFVARQSRTRRAGRSSLKTPLDLARGMVAVCNAAMEKALRVISVERGHDPREFSLICFGGAGGLHAADLARALGLVRVVIPENPGAFSALGILLSDVVRETSQSVLLSVPDLLKDREGPKALARRFARLEQTVRTGLRNDGFPAQPSWIERRLDVRYCGQSYELSIPFTARFAQRFHEEHEKAYGYQDPARPLEIVNLRVRAVIATPKPRSRARRPAAPANVSGARVRRKPVWFDDGARPTPFYERARLRPGAVIRGPAVVVEYSSTTVVPPDFVCRTDEYCNLTLTHDAR